MSIFSHKQEMILKTFDPFLEIILSFSLKYPPHLKLGMRKNLSLKLNTHCATHHRIVLVSYRTQDFSITDF